jgi:photosystem II stability/assembly factor-like uncharacterized protein
MPQTNTSDGHNSGPALLIGTMKGLFIARTTSARDDWSLEGPHFPGQSIYAALYDGRDDRSRMWAATRSMHWGAQLSSSDDLGKTWSVPESRTVRFPEESGAELTQIWQIALGGPEEPDTLYCGVEPAALFVSRDAGESWSLVEGLYNHPHRPQWQPGGGGLCLHTILPDPADPKRIFVAISTGGVYRTDDGGETWRTCHQGVRAQFLPDPYPEFGQCVHKIVSHPERPARLFLQNHWGLYRTDDAGESWQDIAKDVPSDFGFAMEISPVDPNSVFIIPLQSDEFRCCPEGRLRVYRTINGGESWEPLSNGLPQENAYETVLRDGLTSDTLSPAGFYFGTRSGKIFGSRDNGDSWSLIFDGLPPVVAVKSALTA